MKNKAYRRIPPSEDFKGRDDWAPASNPVLRCPEHIVCSGSMWFCTGCGTLEYINYEHGFEQMVEFISQHRRHSP